jgi:hypothetical protein
MKFWKVMSFIMDVLVACVVLFAAGAIVHYSGVTTVFGDSSLNDMVLGFVAWEYQLWDALRSGLGINAPAAQVAASGSFIVIVLAVITWIVTGSKSRSYEEGIATGAIAYRKHHHHHGHSHELGEEVVSSTASSSTTASTTATTEATDESDDEEETKMTLKEKIAAKKAAKAAKKAEKVAAKEAVAEATKAEAAAKPETMSEFLKNLKK